MPELTDEIGKRIRETRRAARMTQRELASRIGTQVSTVTGYENHERCPSAANLRGICLVLNVSADWLLGLSDTKNPRAEAAALSDALSVAAQTVRRAFHLDNEKEGEV